MAAPQLRGQEQPELQQSLQMMILTWLMPWMTEMIEMTAAGDRAQEEEEVFQTRILKTL